MDTRMHRQKHKNVESALIGNERPDQHANQSARDTQSTPAVSFNVRKSIAKNKQKQKVNKDDYPL